MSRRWLLSAFAVSMMVFATSAAAVRAEAPGTGPEDPGTVPPGLALRVFVHHPRGNGHGNSDVVVSSVCADPSAAACGDFGIATTNGKPIVWADPTGGGAGIPFYLLTNWSTRKSPSLTAAGAVEAIDASFAAWQVASDAGLQYARQASAPKKLTVPRLDGRNVVAWKGIQGTALAVTYVWYSTATGHIAEFDMLFNNNIAWSYTAPTIPPSPAYADPTNVGTPRTYDVRAIGTHEAGHTIMLEDLYDASHVNLTMYGYGSPADLSKDTLALGDVLGVEAAY